MLDPWIIEEIRKAERRKKAQQQQQPQLELELPLQRPPTERPEREKPKDSQRGVAIFEF